MHGVIVAESVDISSFIPIRTTAIALHAASIPPFLNGWIFLTSGPNLLILVSLERLSYRIQTCRYYHMESKPSEQ